MGVAGHLGLKPPHVRQILWKLDHIWKKRFNNGTLKANSAPRIGRPPGMRKPGPRRRRYARLFDWNRAVEMRNRGVSPRNIASGLGVSRRAVRNALQKLDPLGKNKRRRRLMRKSGPLLHSRPVRPTT